ncbi:MAG: YggS family pyridoxal phosphate-dependent enzyme [Granulosicoccus sp.]
MTNRPDNVNESTLNIEATLAEVASQITRFEDQYEREQGSVQLLAVSKKKPASAIRTAIAAGQRAFGENYVDEGVEKILDIDDSSLSWHFIGAIQSRKTAQIAEHFQWAHGVDRLKVARRLSEQRPSHLPDLNICLQVNLDNEPSKAGISLAEVAELATHCSTLKGIRLRGLMAIPAPRSSLSEQRKVFALLRTALETLQPQYPDMDTLSMGMSADIEAAIAEGATIVRVGTAIFGARDS